MKRMAPFQERADPRRPTRYRKSPLIWSRSAWGALTRRDVLAVLASVPMFFLGKSERLGPIPDFSARKAMFARRIPVRLP